MYDVLRTYNYDDQPHQLTYPDSETVTYNYDLTSGLPVSLTSLVTDVDYDIAFSPTSVALGTGSSVKYEYDDRGRTERIAYPTSGSTQDLHYDYDPAGNVSQIVDDIEPSTAAFQYDELDRLTTATGAYSASYEYDEIGNMTRIQRGATVQDEIYLAWRHSIIALDDGDGNPNTLTGAYQYDLNGNMIGAEEDYEAGSWDVDGDGCSLAEEASSDVTGGGLRDPSNPWDFYDPNGNGSVELSEIYAVAGKFGATAPGPPYTAAEDRGPTYGPYDHNTRGPDGSIGLGDIFAISGQFGHSCSGGVSHPTLETQFTYDEENRLISRSDASGTTSYVYDGQGTLVQRDQSGVTTTYVDGIYELYSAGPVSEDRKYYWFNGQRVAMRQNGTVLTYLLADHLGSTTAQVDTSGNLVSGSPQRYYPFGSTRSGNLYTDKRFTGHQQEGDLYFMQSRFYDPEIGRFLQPDTIVPDPMDPQSLNRYTYVLNNPLRYTDPTGREPEDWQHCLLGCGRGNLRSAAPPASLIQYPPLYPEASDYRDIWEHTAAVSDWNRLMRQILDQVRRPGIVEAIQDLASNVTVGIGVGGFAGLGVSVQGAIGCAYGQGQFRCYISGGVGGTSGGGVNVGPQVLVGYGEPSELGGGGAELGVCIAFLKGACFGGIASGDLRGVEVMPGIGLDISFLPVPVPLVIYGHGTGTLTLDPVEFFTGGF